MRLASTLVSYFSTFIYAGPIVRIRSSSAHLSTMCRIFCYCSTDSYLCIWGKQIPHHSFLATTSTQVIPNWDYTFWFIGCYTLRRVSNLLQRGSVIIRPGLLVGRIIIQSLPMCGAVTGSASAESRPVLVFGHLPAAARPPHGWNYDARFSQAC